MQEVNVAMQDLSMACSGLGPATIKKAAKEMMPYLGEMLPQGFANVAELQALHQAIAGRGAARK